MKTISTFRIRLAAPAVLFALSGAAPGQGISTVDEAAFSEQAVRLDFSGVSPGDASRRFLAWDLLFSSPPGLSPRVVLDVAPPPNNFPDPPIETYFVENQGDGNAGQPLVVKLLRPARRIGFRLLGAEATASLTALGESGQQLGTAVTVELEGTQNGTFAGLEADEGQTPIHQVVIGLGDSERPERILEVLVDFDDPRPFQLVMAQVGDGPAGADSRLASLLSLVNPSNRTASGRLEFFDGQGQSLTMPLEDGSAVTGLDFTIEAFGARTITTAGAGDQPRAGYALVTADAPVEGSVTFRVRTGSGEILNEAGVLGTRALAGASAPILAEAAGGVGNGLALVNPGTETVTVTLRLIPEDNALFAPMSTEVELAAGEHLARFLAELFEDLQGGYRGSLLAQSLGGSVAVVTVRTRGGLPLVGLPLATTQR